MATREEKIAFIKSKMAEAGPVKSSAQTSDKESAPKTREEKIAFIKQKIAESESNSGGILKPLIQVGETIDAYTGAPTRSAIAAIQAGENPLSAYKNQFGENPNLAPTGKEIAETAGISGKPRLLQTAAQARSFDEKFNPGFAGSMKQIKQDYQDKPDVTPSTAVGFAIDVAADPLNLIGIGAARQGAKFASKAAAEGGIKAAKVAADGVQKIPGAKIVTTAAEVATEAAKNTASAIKSMFTPTQASDFKELVKVAERNGIDPSLLPEAIEFGENSFISRSARHRAEGTLGEKHLNKFHEGLEAVRDAAESKIEKFAGGSVPSAVEAGELIRKGHDDGVDAFFNQIGMTHNKVMEAIPGLQVAPESLSKIDSKLFGIEKWARGRATRGFTAAQRSQADQVLRAIEAVRSGSGSYKQTLETLRDIGEVAFKTKNIMADIPPDIEKFRDLYFTIDEALIDTVERAAGAPVAAELRQSNKNITEFLGDKSVISSIVGNKNLSPEKVFASLVEHGDVKKIQALKKILPPEVFQRLKGTFLASQIRKNADEVFTFKSFHNNLRNKKNVLGALLEPSEIQELSEIIRLGDRFGNPVLSSSGTGASNVFSRVSQGVGDAVANDTVIGLMKDSARGRAAKEVSAASDATKESLKALLPSQVKEIGNKKIPRMAAVAPATARALNNQTKKESGNKESSPVPRALKGKTKWANDGFEKLKRTLPPESLEKLERMKNDLLASSRGQDLLSQISTLPPGSKAFEDAVKKLKQLEVKRNG